MNYNNTLIMYFEGKAIFIDDDNNEVFYIDDKKEVLDLGTSIESNALTSIDKLGEDIVEKILTEINKL
ncbi:MAG: hypothetical protein RR540_00175 [Oscillospiraceae bacterium]